MKKDDIIKELDALKLKIMLDKDLSSDVERYDEWFEKLQGRSKTFSFMEVFDHSDYVKYKTLRNLVDDLYHKKHNGYNYQKNRPEIKRMIAEITAMLLFIQEEICQPHPDHSYLK